MGMIIIAILVAGALSGLTDWLFMGVLFHNAYNTYPEVWRPGIREGTERKAIIVASLLGFVMTAAVVGLCWVARVHDVFGGVHIAVLAWLAGPPFLIIINGMFIKIDPKITIAHCLGYLARNLLAGVAAGLVMGPFAGH